jgi:hypothetical protein
MVMTTQKPESFRFFTRVSLTELTGLKAKNLKELLDTIRTVPGSVIYHHTHHFLQQHQYLSPEPPNDFAYWVSEALNDQKLGEKLAAINICEFSSIKSLREKIITTVEAYLEKNKKPLVDVNEGSEFYFIKSVSFIFPTKHTASNLREFVEGLKHIPIYSIYFHMFEARLRLEKGTNDFSCWLENEMGEPAFAAQIGRLDPYTYTMEGLRTKMIQLIEAETYQTVGSKKK